MVIFLSCLCIWMYVFAVITLRIIDGSHNTWMGLMSYPIIIPLFLAFALLADTWQWFWNRIDERYGEIERIR